MADKVVGGDAGILIAALAQIEATNLSLSQIKNIGTALRTSPSPPLALPVAQRTSGLRLVLVGGLRKTTLPAD